MLTPWKESYDQLGQHVKKQRYHLAGKVPIVKVTVFPVVLYGHESWTIKKIEYWRTHAFDCGAGEDSWESLGLQGDQTS